jgi:hypothetical protein
MRLAVLAFLAAILIGVAYLGGEQHRQSCILEPGPSTGCSILPWSEGQPPAKKAAPAPNLFDGIVIQ